MDTNEKYTGIDSSTTVVDKGLHRETIQELAFRSYDSEPHSGFTVWGQLLVWSCTSRIYWNKFYKSALGVAVRAKDS